MTFYIFLFYTIDHLEPNISQLSILYDLNPPNYSDDLDDARITTRNHIFEDGIASCCGKYGSVTFIPTKNDSSFDHLGEEFIFIVDCSGSMRGQEIELAADCLIFFIKSLPEDCFFNIIRFGSTFVPLFPKPVPYTDANSQKAQELAFFLQADLGGTRLSKPLESVFTNPPSRSNKLRRIFVRLCGGGYPPLPARTFCNVNAEDLVSIVSEQKVEGCWNNIPSFFSRSDNQKVKTAIQKVQRWAKMKRFQMNENKVVGTVISLFYMVSYKKELHKIWELVYQKALKWLISINKTINWEAIIKSI